MKAYLIVTGLIFALIAAAHMARVALEGAHVLTRPLFIVFTLLAIGMFAWTIAMYRKI